MINRVILSGVVDTDSFKLNDGRVFKLKFNITTQDGKKSKLKSIPVQAYGEFAEMLCKNRNKLIGYFVLFVGEINCNKDRVIVIVRKIERLNKIDE